MNKSELVAKMAKDAGITKTAARKALNSLVEATSDASEKGDRVSVTLVNFGTRRRPEERTPKRQAPRTQKKAGKPGKPTGPQAGAKRK